VAAANDEHLSLRVDREAGVRKRLRDHLGNLTQGTIGVDVFERENAHDIQTGYLLPRNLRSAVELLLSGEVIALSPHEDPAGCRGIADDLHLFADLVLVELLEYANEASSVPRLMGMQYPQFQQR